MSISDREPQGMIRTADAWGYWQREAIAARATGDTKRERYALNMLILIGDPDVDQ